MLHWSIAMLHLSSAILHFGWLFCGQSRLFWRDKSRDKQHKPLQPCFQPGDLFRRIWLKLKHFEGIPTLGIEAYWRLLGSLPKSHNTLWKHPKIPQYLGDWGLLRRADLCAARTLCQCSKQVLTEHQWKCNSPFSAFVGVCYWLLSKAAWSLAWRAWTGTNRIGQQTVAFAICHRLQ